MTGNGGAKGWGRVVRRLLEWLTSGLATPWLLAAGAAIVSLLTRWFEATFWDYTQLPLHAKLLAPTISASLGISLVLAMTLFFRENNLYQRTGYRRAYPVCSYLEGSQPNEKYLRRGIGDIGRVIASTSGSRTCRLLLVSGYYYLTAAEHRGQKNYLPDLLRAAGRVQVLLLNPFKEMSSPVWWAQRRAITCDPSGRVPPNEYVSGILELCDRLMAMRAMEEVEIEIGFYNFSPSWQLFLNGEEAIVQPVFPRRHSQYNPMYLFQATDYSLYIPFQRYFNLIWNRWKTHLSENHDFYLSKGLVPTDGHHSRMVYTGGESTSQT